MAKLLTDDDVFGAPTPSPTGPRAPTAPPGLLSDDDVFAPDPVLAGAAGGPSPTPWRDIVTTLPTIADPEFLARQPSGILGSIQSWAGGLTRAAGEAARGLVTPLSQEDVTPLEAPRTGGAASVLEAPAGMPALNPYAYTGLARLLAQRYLPQPVQEATGAVGDVLTQAGISAADAGARRMEEAVPRDATIAQQAFGSGVQSLTNSALGALGAIARRDPTVMLGTLGAQEAGRQYGEAREAGLGGVEAMRSGARSAAVEVVTEKLPTDALFREAPSLGRKVLRFLARELPAEWTAETAQLYNDLYSGIRENVTSDDVAHTLAVTTLATIISGGGQAALVHYAQGAGQKEAVKEALGGVGVSDKEVDELLAYLDKNTKPSAPTPGPMPTRAQRPAPEVLERELYPPQSREVPAGQGERATIPVPGGAPVPETTTPGTRPDFGEAAVDFERPPLGTFALAARRALEQAPALGVEGDLTPAYPGGIPYAPGERTVQPTPEQLGEETEAARRAVQAAPPAAPAPTAESAQSAETPAVQMPEGPAQTEEGRAYVVRWADGRAQATYRTRDAAQAFAEERAAEGDLDAVRYERKPEGARYLDTTAESRERTARWRGRYSAGATPGALTPTPQEAGRAEAVRGDQGQVPVPGAQRARGEVASRPDLQREAPVEPGDRAPRGPAVAARPGGVAQAQPVAPAQPPQVPRGTPPEASQEVPGEAQPPAGPEVAPEAPEAALREREQRLGAAREGLQGVAEERGIGGVVGDLDRRLAARERRVKERLAELDRQNTGVLRDITAAGKDAGRYMAAWTELGAIKLLRGALTFQAWLDHMLRDIPQKRRQLFQTVARQVYQRAKARAPQIRGEPPPEGGVDPYEVAGRSLTAAQRGVSAIDLMRAEPDPARLKRRTATLAGLADWLTARSLRALGGQPLLEQSPRTREFLARVWAAEVKDAVQEPGNAGAWYSVSAPSAIDKAATVFPELASDQTARGLFSLGLAITSNGAAVGDNVRHAMQVYEALRRDGRFPISGWGQVANQMKNGFSLANAMLDEYGPEATVKFLNSSFTVEELRRAGFNVSGEASEEVMNGSAVFGPKVGAAFYQNVTGNLSPLTMDRWFMRTIGRWSGRLLGGREDKVEDARNRFIASISDEFLARHGYQPHQLVTESDVEDAARRIYSRWAQAGYKIENLKADDVAGEEDVSEDLEEEGEEERIPKDADEFHRSARELAKALDEPLSTPTQAERPFYRDVASRAADLLREDGYDYSPADLQAIVWFYEKDLYRRLGVSDKKSEKTDYDTEMTRYLEERAREEAAPGRADERGGDPARASDRRPEFYRREGFRGGPRDEGARDPFGRPVFGDRERRSFLRARNVIAARHESVRKREGAVPRPFGRRDRGAVELLTGPGKPKKLPAKAEFTLPANRVVAKRLGPVGIDLSPIYELESSDNAALAFQEAITAAKDANPHGAAVFVYDVADYRKMRLFLMGDGRAGFALKGDDIVSVFNSDSKAHPMASVPMVMLAVQEGGRRLDAFDTTLPHLYAMNGFRVVSRIAWDDSQAPPGWDKETFRAYRGGEPDVVFMALDPSRSTNYKPGEGRFVDTYDEAVELQLEAARTGKFEEVDDPLLSLWHGTIAEFDVPSARFALTGEGAQAYGAGEIYLAERRGVAKNYRDDAIDRARDLEEDTLLYGEEEFTGTFEGLQRHETLDLIDNVLAMSYGTSRAEGIAATARSHRETLDLIESQKEAMRASGNERGVERVEERAQMVRAKLAALESPDIDWSKFNHGFDRPVAGQLYEFQIPKRDLDKMLNWDASVSENPDAVQKAIDDLIESRKLELPQPKLSKFKPAGVVYNELVDAVWEQGGDRNRNVAMKEVSRALRDRGVLGIKYFDAGSRRRGEGTRNVVLFDVSRIRHARRNGTPLYSFPGPIMDPDTWRDLGREIRKLLSHQTAQNAGQWLHDERTARWGGLELAHGDQGRIGVWMKTIGTPFHLAQQREDFGKFFWATQRYLNKISNLTVQAQDMLPSWFQDGLFGRTVRAFAGHETPRSRHAAMALLRGTLDKTVYGPAELAQLGLNDPEIAMYEEARKAVDFMLAQVGDALIAEGADPAQVFDRVQRLQREGYFPLQRFGKYYVERRDYMGNVTSFQLFESQRAAKHEAAKQRRRFGTASTVTTDILPQMAHRLFKGLTTDTIEAFAELLGVDQDVAYQEYLKHAVANRSALKRMIHRKGTPGFSFDGHRVLADFIVSNARLAARGQHWGDMSAAARDIRAGDVQDYATEQLGYLEDPGEEYGGARGFLFFHFLGGNISSALVNLTQVPVMTVPYLTQHASTPEVVRQVTVATKDAVRFALNDQVLTGDLGRALRKAEADGVTNAQSVYAMMGIAQGSKLARVGELSQALDAWAYLFSSAEKQNRRSTFIAAYRLARNRGDSDQQAHQFAVEAVDQTQYVYNKGNRPRWARGVLSVPFTFKLFTVNTVEILTRLPVKQKAMILAALALGAGMEGLPFAEDLQDMIDAVGQRMGYNTGSKRWLTRNLNAMFEEFMGMEPEHAAAATEAVRHGVFALTPFSIGPRLSMGNVIPGTEALKMSERQPLREASEALGPAAGVIDNLASAIALARRGEGYRAAEKVLPVGVSNMLKGARQLATGEETTAWGRRVTDVPATEALGKMIGFTGTTTAQAYDRESMVRQAESYAREVEGAIAHQWARGLVDGDPDAVREARRRLAEYNRLNPDVPIEITPRQIKSRMRNLRMAGEERLRRSLGTERRGLASDL